MTLPCLDHTVPSPSESQETPDSAPQVDKPGKEQTKSSISPKVLASPLPPTPRRSPRQPGARDSTEDVECLGWPSPASRKRKRGETDSESPELAKVRRISDSSTTSVATGSGESAKAKALKESKASKDGKAKVKHEKKAHYFKLNEGYRYMAWPLADSDDARALIVPQYRKPRDITPMGLEKFDLDTILQSPIFSEACTVAGMDDLKRVYAEVTSVTAPTSKGGMWSDGISTLVFLACQLFIPRDIFLYDVQDIKPGRKNEPMGPLTFYGAPLERNYLIAAIVSLSTGIFFANKMISSHQQHILKLLRLQLTPTSKKKAGRITPAEEQRLSEIIDLCEFGSPTAHDSMSDYIATVKQLRKARVKGKGKRDKQGIPLLLHPLLAFFIKRNGSFIPGRPQPENRLIDVSDDKKYHLPWPFAWGWYFWCLGESVPDGEHKEKEESPFGHPDAPLAKHRYYSPSDIERSGYHTSYPTEQSSLESVEDGE